MATTPATRSFVAVTGTVIWPYGELTRTTSPSADLQFRCVVDVHQRMVAWPPRISSGELCIHEFSERGSRMPIIRSG